MRCSILRFISVVTASALKVCCAGNARSAQTIDEHEHFASCSATAQSQKLLMPSCDSTLGEARVISPQECRLKITQGSDRTTQDMSSSNCLRWRITVLYAKHQESLRLYLNVSR